MDPCLFPLPPSSSSAEDPVALYPHVALSELCCALLSHPAVEACRHLTSSASPPQSGDLSLTPCLVCSQQFLVYAGYCVKLKSKESTVWGCAGWVPSLAVLWAAFCHRSSICDLCSGRPKAETGRCYSAPANWR